MADQTVQKIGELSAKRIQDLARQNVNLSQRICQAVSNLDVLAPQLPHELHVVIAGNAEGGAALDHVPYQTDHIENSWTAINQIAHKDGLATFWMAIGDTAR